MIRQAMEGRPEVAVKYDKLRSQLENEKIRLTDELDLLKASVRPAEERREGSPFGKREEEATETLELEKRLAIEERIKGLIVSVEHALQKFEDGTYGLCDSCGKKIDPERLEALPQASLCLECKTSQSKNARGK